MLSLFKTSVESLKRSNNHSQCVFFNTDTDDHRCVVILTVKRATGTFSLIGCLWMLFVIWLLRRYNSVAQKMILSLTIAAFFDSIAYVMGDSNLQGSLCDFQAWWLTYFDWSALAWVCLITLNLYFNLVCEISTNRFEIFYHLTAWGVPLVMASLPLLKGVYGPAGGWCWITGDHVAWRFGIWYVPLFTLILLMICCYARIIFVANKRDAWSKFSNKNESRDPLYMQSWLGTFNPERERRKVSLAEDIRPLKWYPSVYLLVSIFPLINRLHNAIYPQDPSFSLTLLHVLSAPLHGLANSFVFGLDRDWWSLLSLTGMQLALQSRLCDEARIGEYHLGAVRYTQADLADLSEDEDDANVLFYSPNMALKDRGP